MAKLKAKPKKRTPAKQQAQAERAAAMWQERFATMKATYDAARTSTEYQNIWANADRLDADSAHSKTVRHDLISRSRYEVGSNGYSDGIAQTYATDLVGTGPMLRMQTGSEGFNRLIENQWYLWSKAINLHSKLWCMAHAKHVDGEAFAVMRRNPGVPHPLKLDLQLYEAEQIQTPYLPYGTEGYIDGIKFDKFGNPEWYDVLPEHPGCATRVNYNMTPERVPANRMLHWFKMRRPGQHRGVPESASTLNVGAAARRWREATLGAAETAADFTLFLKTQFQPDSDEMQYATDFSQQEITKRMMTALPLGYDPFQMKAEQPTASYEGFHKSLVSEQARPKSMPYNRAAADSSGHNFASGKLDYLPYFSSLGVDRETGNVLLDKLFGSWFDLAVLFYGWLGGNPAVITSGARAHLWDWPELTIGDQEATANANKTCLSTGQTTLSKVFSRAGLDFEDEVIVMAKDYGVTVDEMRRILRDATFNAQNQQASMKQAETQAEVATAEPAKPSPVAAILAQRNGHKLNGVH